MGNHALLSASSSHRWLNCPPSARLGENYEDKGSDFAAEGTDAHSLCEHKLKTALGITSEDPTENLTWYNEEMEECASGYAAYVLELLAEAKKVTTDPTVVIDLLFGRDVFVVFCVDFDAHSLTDPLLLFGLLLLLVVINHRHSPPGRRGAVSNPGSARRSYPLGLPGNRKPG